MYALADCNNFFASCERVFRPDLEGKPVMVLSGNDGCVIARSNEVKALGIKMGTPLFQIRELVEQEHINCFSSNFELYGDLSARVMHLLSRYTDQLEQYSIDEAFLHFDDSMLTAEQQVKQARQIVREIRQGIGIPVSIGIAPSRTLAKIASKYAKQYAGYRGACMIDTTEKRLKALSTFPIEDVWGIGRRSVKKLHTAGINTALDFASHQSEFALNLMHKPGLDTWQELNGQDVIRTDELAQHLSITRSRTFAAPVTDIKTMEAFIADFCATCARKLRSQNSLCSDIIIFALPSRFSYSLPKENSIFMPDSGVYDNFGGIYQNIHLPVPTNTTSELLEYVLRTLRKNFIEGYSYKRAGIVLHNISDATAMQQQLFDTRDRQRDSQLQQTIDRLNRQMGRNTIRVATQLKTEQQADKLRSEHLSPCYSTRLSDIITVKC